MFNKIKLLSTIGILAICSIFLVACGGGKDNEDNELKDISGIAYISQSYDYTGEQKSLEINGELPEGIKVTYSNNVATDVGVYNAKAVLTGDGYKKLELFATLEIKALNFVGYKFNDFYKVYDGKEKEVLIEGPNLSDISIAYSNNKATDAGVYNATAILNKKGYKTLTLNAKLEIGEANITSLSFEDGAYTYDGTTKSISIIGNLPTGVSVVYTNNDKTEVGNYEVIATLNGKNYKELQLKAQLNIKPNYAGYALNVISQLFKMPNAWSFLPESFELSHRQLNDNLDFSSSYVLVNDIPKNGVGKQLNVIYENLLRVDDLMVYLNNFYQYSDIIVDLYQTFLNDNPDNYMIFERQTENFSFKLELTNDKNTLLAQYMQAAIEIEYNKDSKESGGRIQLGDGNAIKYVFNENKLHMALNISDVVMYQMKFERVSNIIKGYIYEYAGIDSASIKTTTLIEISQDTTNIISNKRETDDLIIDGYLEVYDNGTGNLIASEVKETNKAIDYDTIWFNLFDIEGINSIKILDTQNGLNLDTIYINGNENPFKVKRNNFGFGSRQFDIELKDMYFYVFNPETDKYEKVKINIPMLFVQQENLEDYEQVAYNENKNNGLSNKLNNNLTNQEISNLIDKYNSLVEKYNQLKTQVSKEEILSFIGIKNIFFN